jgi:hypothetical protein
MNGKNAFGELIPSGEAGVTQRMDMLKKAAMELVNAMELGILHEPTSGRRSIHEYLKLHDDTIRAIQHHYNAALIESNPDRRRKPLPKAFPH